MNTPFTTSGVEDFCTAISYEINRRSSVSGHCKNEGYMVRDGYVIASIADYPVETRRWEVEVSLDECLFTFTGGKEVGRVICEAFLRGDTDVLRPV